MLARFAVGWALLTGAAIFAEVKVPPIHPQITGTFPRGGQRGTEVQVTLQGRNLQDTTAILFKTKKLTATVLRSNPYSVTATIRIACRGRAWTARPASHRQTRNGHQLFHRGYVSGAYGSGTQLRPQASGIALPFLP